MPDDGIFDSGDFDGGMFDAPPVDPPLTCGKFTIDSSMDLAVDSYTANDTATSVYLDADPSDSISLSVGLINPATGTAYTIDHLDGEITEYELRVNPNSVIGSIRGRDNMAKLRDRPYQMRFLRAQPGPLEKIAMEQRTFGTVHNYPDPIRYTVGKFRASDIARKVVEFWNQPSGPSGLTLSWECRDYDIQEDFDASGRPIDILRKLVDPWSQIEALKVDVFIRGATVICRPRSLTPTADYSYAIKDARIKDIDLRRRRTDIYGRVTLQGEFNLRAKAIGSIIPQEVTVTTEDDSGFTVNNRPLMKVVRATTYLVPPRIPIKISEQTYTDNPAANWSMDLIKDETTTNEWEPIQTTDVGVVNQPRQLSQTVVTKGYPKGHPEYAWQVVAKEITTYAYGGMGILQTDMFGNNLTGFQSMTTTQKWELDINTGGLNEVERLVKTWRENGNLETVCAWTRYQWTAQTGTWNRVDGDTNTSGGVAPGGPRPDRTVMIGGTGVDPRDQIKIEDWISTDPEAKDITYNNRSLKQEDLDWLKLQFEATSGIWRNEILLTYVSMPWLRKGDVLEITGLVAEDGTTPIPIGPALVVEQHLNYDESSPNASMTSTLRALWWTAL